MGTWTRRETQGNPLSRQYKNAVEIILTNNRYLLGFVLKKIFFFGQALLFEGFFHSDAQSSYQLHLFRR